MCSLISGKFVPSMLVSMMSLFCFSCSENGDSSQPGAEKEDETKVCGRDSVTRETLEKAKASLNEGATDVNLGLEGCIRFSRLKTNGVVQENIYYKDIVNISISHEGDSRTYLQDEDLDGFFEWRAHFRSGNSSVNDEIVIEEYNPEEKTMIRRKTYTHDETKIHVVIEKKDVDGTSVVAREFDLPMELYVGDEETPNKTKATQCSADDVALVKLRLKEAMLGVSGQNGHEGGISCLSRLDDSAKSKRLQALYLTRDDSKIKIICDDKNFYEGVGWFDGTIRIHINMNYFKSRSSLSQRQLLFHEMMHELFVHEDGLQRDFLRITEIDPAESCALTCWPDAFTTKCHCATCLGTDVCDSRCSGYKDCDPVIAYRCPCKSNENRFYTTCSECLSGCPSGLICSFYSTCDPIGVASERCGHPPVTCP